MAAEQLSGVSGRQHHSDSLAVDWSTVCDTMSGRETRYTCLLRVTMYPKLLIVADVMELHGVGREDAASHWFVEVFNSSTVARS